MEETLELTPEEQESLAIGEEMEAQQQEMLAGKFENAEQLEKAYLELQSKLGQPRQEAEPEPQAEPEPEPEANPFQQNLMKAAQEYTESGQMSPETLAQFDNMSSREVVEAVMNMELPQQQQEAADLSTQEVNQIKNLVGGEQGYTDLMEWANEALPASVIQNFDSLVSSAGSEMIQLAVLGLQSYYQKSNGYEGNMVTGRTAPTQQDVFRSQAEVVSAMQDPRYDSDPAFREDVFNKLSRSNIDM
jgi:hypothetical protein